MAYEPLHHKYRPQTFADLVGQETIALTLSNALQQAKIAPAYLFTGPRGTGKTSSARILAKSLNCLNSDRPTPDPCGKCEVCLAIAKGSALDVTEIDAASNTGVDNIREIIERSRFAPVQCRYKIYVVDECHMLSTAAFNALLKTLEEPPPRVVFVLATTDPQRVLSTIISRCQRFDYRRIPLIEMTSHLRYIANAEGIAIADDALTLVAQIANGGLRDAESLLDQLSLLPETITVEKVWDLVGAVPEQDLLKLLQAINHHDSLAILQQCRSLLDRGREPLVVLQNLANFYLNLLIAKTAPEHSELTAVTETCWQQLTQEAKNWQTASILKGQQHLQEGETQLKRTTQPRLWLEVTLLGLLPEANLAPNISATPSHPSPPSKALVIEANNHQQKIAEPNITEPPSAPPKQAVNEATPVAQEPVRNQPTAPVNHLNHAPQTAIALPPSPVSNHQQDAIANQEIWTKVVSCLQPPTTQALLKQQCHLVSFDGSSAIVGVSSANLQKMTQQKIPNIETAFAQVCQRKVGVQLEVASSQGNIMQPSRPSSNQSSQPVVETPSSAPEQPPPVRMETVPLQDHDSIKAHNFTNQTQGTAPSVVQTATVTIAKDDSSPVIATQNDSVTSSPIIAADVSLESHRNNLIDSHLSPSVISDIAVTEDYQDHDLEEAINSLTQSFEGELVQLDNLNNALDKAVEDEDDDDEF